jgi:hypothetical protein
VDLQSNYASLKMMVMNYLYFYSELTDKEFFQMIQFLSFIHYLNKNSQFEKANENTVQQIHRFNIVELAYEQFYVTKFTSSTYRKFIELNADNQNQRKSILGFLINLQRKPPLQIYLHTSLMKKIANINLIPVVRAISEPGKPWIILVAVSERLLDFRYPFWFHKPFSIYKNNSDLTIKLAFMRCLVSSKIDKELNVKILLKNLSGNSKRIKKNIAFSTFLFDRK